jgi:hypothetical protein
MSTRRATNVHVVRSRLARKATASVEAKLGDWQKQIARLRGLAERQAHERDRLIEARIEALASTIQATELALGQSIATLPSDIREHDRIVDVKKALSVAALTVDQLKWSLNPDPQLAPALGRR